MGRRPAQGWVAGMKLANWPVPLRTAGLAMVDTV
jgi:hypothetical protein